MSNSLLPFLALKGEKRGKWSAWREEGRKFYLTLLWRRGVSETVKSASHEDEGIFTTATTRDLTHRKKRKKEKEKRKSRNMRQCDNRRGIPPLRLIVLPTCAKNKIPCAAHCHFPRAVIFAKEKYAGENWQEFLLPFLLSRGGFNKTEEQDKKWNRRHFPYFPFF